MTVQDRWLRVPLSSITVRRDARQENGIHTAGIGDEAGTVRTQERAELVEFVHDDTPSCHY